MKINKVTITGADDSINPLDLFEISKKYPFVEWGILLSKNSMGHNRFPSEDWIRYLHSTYQYQKSLGSAYSKIQFSGHLCGTWVRELISGAGFTFLGKMQDVHEIFSRFQINTHGEVIDVKLNKFVAALQLIPSVQYIFQIDGVNDPLVDIVKEKVNCAILFDKSSGIGLLPDSWPKCRENIYCGYAGGLSPQNLEEQLVKISEVVPPYNTIWIDVETRVRSNDDKQFDLNLVTEFLEISKKYVTA